MKILLLVNSEQDFVWEEKGGKKLKDVCKFFFCGYSVIWGRGRLIGGWKFLFCFGIVCVFFPWKSKNLAPRRGCSCLLFAIPEELLLSL